MKKFLIGLFIVFIMYFTMTPSGAVRHSIFWHGYPLHAVTFNVTKDLPATFRPAENQVGYSFTDNPPYASITDTQMYNWVATRYGIFYIGSYFGWC